MADTLSENLKNEIATRASWTTPCTFKRTNRIPIDAKSCFKTYDELEAYINDPESTAYPGMFVAVTSNQDARKGGYILMGDEEDNLVPISVSGIKSLSLKGDEGSEIQAEVDNTGHATISLDEVEFDELKSNNLYVNEWDIGTVLTRLNELSRLPRIENDNYTIEYLKDILNYIIDVVKHSFEVEDE